MANNKVIFGDTTIMDITDTTAEASDVAAGEVFYNKSGVRTLGTGDYMSKVANPTANDILVTDANGQAIDSGVPIDDVAMSSDLPEQATETTLGLIKLNSGQSIGLNADGQLEVGGRIGQFEGTTGLFAPNDREPRNVLDYSFLITDAMGMDMSANRAYALVTGLGVNCRSASAGATQYRIQNTYSNRILAKLCENGYASRDEATSKEEQIVPVVSVQIGGSSYTPDSSANPSGTANDIIITTAETLNPDSAITNIRLFGKIQSYATAHIGNGIASWGGGRNFLLGGGVIKDGSSNDDCAVGNGIYVSGNGNAIFGRYHIVRKNRGFFAGQGHDSTNATGEGVSAIGQYSYIDSNTLFAVGNGTNHTTRLNAFEVLKDGSIVLRSPNGTRFKISVDNSGNLSTTQL